MSKINQLIQNHCPAGVEYKKLEDVLTIKNGRDYKQFGDGDVPVYGSGGIMTYINTAVYDKPSVLIPRKGSLDKLYYVDTPFWNVDTIFYTDIDTSLVEPKYIYYYLEGQHLERLNKAGGVPSLTQAVLNKVQLPVPPLEVQREIVRILDNFTSLKAELQTKLQAELQARKKQYEYYRDKLLSFASDIPLFQLGKVCDLQAGKAIKASEISDIETNQETIPCYGANGLRGYVGKSNQKGDKSIIGRQGAQCGNVCYATGKYYATEHAVVVTDKGYFNSRYLFHVLTHANLNQYKTAGAQPGLSVSKLNNVMIAVPDKKVQDKIANILDNFEKICSDLNIGLPAEIEARQKQYEFYHDALLSFDNSYFVNVERERERERERDEWHSGLIKLWQYVFGYVYLKLDDIIHSLNTGLNPRQFFKLNTDDSTNYYITIREIHGGKIVPTDKTDRINDEALKLCNNRSNLAIGDILFSGTGTIGETAVIADEPNNWNIKEGVYSIKPNTKYVLPKFLRYLLMSNPIKETYMKKVAGGTVKSIPMGELRKIVLPVPPLEEQKLIVSILDRFDKLCNDISEGLPAEIEARQKQYEYYRDKLLSF